MPLAANVIHPTMQRASNPRFPNNSEHAGRLSMIFRLRRVADKQLVKEHRLIVMPTTFQKDTEGRSQIYYTRDGIFVDVPLRNGIGLTYFAISGTTLFRGVLNTEQAVRAPGILTGLEDVLGVATSIFQGRPQRGSVIDGAAAIKDFEETILQYFFPDSYVSTTGLSPADIQLEFLNLNAPVSSQDQTGLVAYRIHPHRNLVTLRQDARHPFLWYYQFQFAGIELLRDAEIPDSFINDFTGRDIVSGRVLDALNTLVRETVNGVNRLTDATDRLVQQVTGPVSTFLAGVTQLSAAVQQFVGGVSAKIQFPLYARRTLQNAIDAPAHSVSTLRTVADDVIGRLTGASQGRSTSGRLPATSLTANVNDRLVISLNGEAPVTLALGTITGGAAIAAAIQAGIRATAPAVAVNAAAYRDFTATFTDGLYVLTSGTRMSDAASVRVGLEDAALTPQDAAPVLRLGGQSGGLEEQGSARALRAIHLLRGVHQACDHLLAFPDFFADSLEAQSDTVQQVHSAAFPGQQIRGAQTFTEVRITPGDTLQAIATRVNLPWQMLALANHLSYPYILSEPTTLREGRVTSANQYRLVDTTQTWTPNQFQAQRLDLLEGEGAGQSAGIVSNTADTLILDTSWGVLPDTTTTYAIRSASNPIVRTSTVTGSGSHTLADSAVTLVPDSQQGLTIILADGQGAGQRRRIRTNDRTAYQLEVPWLTLPAVGTLYVVVESSAAIPRRFRLVGDVLAVPFPAAPRRPRAVRTALIDSGTITGDDTDPARTLFGTDLLLEGRTLVWDVVREDLALIHGTANLRQAILMKINAALGEWEHHPSLGSYVQEALGLTATLPTQREILHSVERTVREDPRIATMDQVTLQGRAGQLQIAFTARAITGDAVDRIVVR
jgi:phage baseplate assembly protein W